MHTQVKGKLNTTCLPCTKCNALWLALSLGCGQFTTGVANTIALRLDLISYARVGCIYSMHAHHTHNYLAQQRLVEYIYIVESYHKPILGLTPTEEKEEYIYIYIHNYIHMFFLLLVVLNIYKNVIKI